MVAAQKQTCLKSPEQHKKMNWIDEIQSGFLMSKALNPYQLKGGCCSHHQYRFSPLLLAIQIPETTVKIFRRLDYRGSFTFLELFFFPVLRVR